MPPERTNKKRAHRRRSEGSEEKSPFSFDDYDNVIGFVVSQAGYRLGKALEYILETVGSDLRPREFALLNRLHQHGALTQIRLAELTYKDKPAITRMLDRLIERKFVRKVPSPEDRRAFVVSLTARGEEVRNRIVPLMADLLAAACKDLSRRELETTISTLKKISARV